MSLVAESCRSRAPAEKSLAMGKEVKEFQLCDSRVQRTSQDAQDVISGLLAGGSLGLRAVLCCFQPHRSWYGMESVVLC